MLTINNPKIPLSNLFDQWMSDGLIVFGIGQLEKGASGTPHYQIYIQTKKNDKNRNGFTMKWVKDNIHPTAHIEIRRGTHEQALKYCSKEDTRVENPVRVGEPIKADGEFTKADQQKGGEKNTSKILAIKRKIDDGARDEELYEEHFGEMLRYSKSFERYRTSMRSKHRTWPTRAIVLYGPPGTGKSTMAYERARAKYGDDYYPLTLDSETVWWDGYSGQKCVVVEEFYGNMKIGYLLKLLDKFPLLVQTKGGMTPFLAETIIFTSNVHPDQWYGKLDSTIPQTVIDALKRRLTPPLGYVKEYTEVVPNTDVTITAEMIWNDMGLLKEVQDKGEVLDLVSEEEEPEIDYTDISHLDNYEADTDDALQDLHDIDDALQDEDDDVDDKVVTPPPSQVRRAGFAADDATIKAWAQSRPAGTPMPPTKIARTDEFGVSKKKAAFGIIPPPKASDLAFRQLKQIPGQAKLVLEPAEKPK